MSKATGIFNNFDQPLSNYDKAGVSGVFDSSKLGSRVDFIRQAGLDITGQQPVEGFTSEF